MSLIQAYAYTSTATGKTQRVEPTYEAIVKHVREEFLGLRDTATVAHGDQALNKHRRRRKHMEERLRFYRDDYIEDVAALVDLIFEDAKVKHQRKKLAELAMAMNVSKRIVNEISPVYDKPAKRSLKTKGATEEYRRFAGEAELDETLQQAHQLVNFCNELLLWRTGDRSLRIITPDSFDPIPDPENPLQPAGYLIDWSPVSLSTGPDRSQLAHYKLWDDTVVVDLNADGRMIGNPRPHGLGRMPGVLVHRSKPIDRLMDDTSGRDILGAHKAVVLLNLMVLRLSKSQGERQPVLKGMLARVAKGQSMDGETPIALPPDVDLSMLDSKTDPDHFLKVIRHYIAGVAQAYGMSYEQFTFSETADTASGKAYSVRRERLTEIRNAQAKRWRRVEPQLAELFGFSAEKFSVDFHEMGLPQDAAEEVELLDKKMRMGLDSPKQFLLRHDPDLDDEAAAKRIRENLEATHAVWAMARTMNAPQRSGDAESPGKTPQENGGDNDSTPTRAAIADDQQATAA